MKVISTVEELESLLAANPGRRGDLDTLLPVPGESLERWVLSGNKIMVPETPGEHHQAAAGMLAAMLRRIARESGWKEAARQFLRVGGQPLLGGKALASFAAYLRKRYA